MAEVRGPKNRAPTTVAPKKTVHDFERFRPESVADLSAWLRAHHQTSPGVWLVVNRPKSGLPFVPYDEIVEELLCWGWVDGRAGANDDVSSMLLCSPRRANSGWAATNKARIAKLLATGRMQERGLAVVQEAKRSGAWDALNDVENLVVPDDLSAELARFENATAYWEAFPKSVKRGILDWIRTAKRPETRAARINETATMASKNERANQWKKKAE